MSEKLHIFRFRAVGEPSFYDSNTDIRSMFPKIVDYVLSMMEDKYDSTDRMQDILYLHQCVEVFKIRIIEDKLAVESQVTEFLAAIVEVPAELRFEFTGMVFNAFFCIYALFCRRDSAVDGDALQAMLEYTRLSLLKDLLSPETYGKVKEELQAKVPLLVQSNVSTGSVAVCQETGEEFTRLKEIACQFMSCSGNQSWNTLADLCDKEFLGGKNMSDSVGMALALAYPTYKHPTLSVELTKDGTEGKAEEPEERT